MSNGKLRLDCGRLPLAAFSADRCWALSTCREWDGTKAGVRTGPKAIDGFWVTSANLRQATTLSHRFHPMSKALTELVAPASNRVVRHDHPRSKSSSSMSHKLN
jgi:hypothetical protein